MTLFLMLPGSPIPDWLVLLLPLAVLLLLIYSGEKIYKWYKNRLAMQQQAESMLHDEIVVDNSTTEI